MPIPLTQGRFGAPSSCDADLSDPPDGRYRRTDSRKENTDSRKENSDPKSETEGRKEGKKEGKNSGS
jgi:hypothetical protein